MEDYFTTIRIRISVLRELKILKAKTGKKSYSDMLIDIMKKYEGEDN